MALTPRVFTLLLENQGGTLWDEEGHFLLFLPALAQGASTRVVWGEALKDALPKGAKVQLVLGKSNLETRCQATPYLSARERKEVQRRLLPVESTTPHTNIATAFDTDAQADGGHQLWLVWHPALEIHEWLGAVQYAGAKTLFATSLQRACLAGLDADDQVRFWLGIHQDNARLLLFHGKELLLQRSFQLPPDLNALVADDHTIDALAEILSAEISRSVQFIKQKFRQLSVNTLYLAGLPKIPPSLLEQMTRSRIALVNVSTRFSSFLIKGVQNERAQPRPLNLIPIEILSANRFRVVRASVWSSVAVMVAGLALAYWFLARNEKQLKSLLISTTSARDTRKKLLEEAEQVGRFRFGLMRLRKAEQHQKAAIEKLDELSTQLFQTPQDMLLETVTITQVPGETIRYQFELNGTTLSDQRFSLGPVADYMKRLSAHRITLQPLRDVSIADQPTNQDQAPPKQAVTRFTLTGAFP